MLLDEFRSSKYCSKHRFELSDIVDETHHAVCGKCVARKDDAESLVRKRFALKDINEAIAARGKRSKEVPKRSFSSRVNKIRERANANSPSESTTTIINDIAFLLGSKDGGDTIVERGPSGRKILHYMATRSPPSAHADPLDAVHHARTMIAEVRLKQLTRRQLVERRRRLVARARCANCPKSNGRGGKQPKRCNNCRHVKEMNKHKTCFLCKHELVGPDDVYIVARRHQTSSPSQSRVRELDDARDPPTTTKRQSTIAPPLPVPVHGERERANCPTCPRRPPAPASPARSTTTSPTTTRQPTRAPVHRAGTVASERKRHPTPTPTRRPARARRAPNTVDAQQQTVNAAEHANNNTLHHYYNHHYYHHHHYHHNHADHHLPQQPNARRPSTVFQSDRDERSSRPVWRVEVRP